MRTVLMQVDHMPRSNKIIGEKEKELSDKQKQLIKSAAEAAGWLLVNGRSGSNVGDRWHLPRMQQEMQASA